jgi:predicted fused transcriptional regulator/phosphomethylpyrimidine kinase
MATKINAGERDEVLEALRLALSRFEEHREFTGLIPEVGTNIVYAREGAESIGDVAGLSGRVIRSMGAPRVCGEVVYGGSTHLGSAILEAHKIDPTLRAAVNVKGQKRIAEALGEMSLDVATLPPVGGEGCPVTDHLRKTGVMHDAFYHPGAFGIEPTTTILAGNPGRLIGILEELSRRV